MPILGRTWQARHTLALVTVCLWAGSGVVYYHNYGLDWVLPPLIISLFALVGGMLYRPTRWTAFALSLLFIGAVLAVLWWG